MRANIPVYISKIGSKKLTKSVLQFSLLNNPKTNCQWNSIENL